MSLAKLSAYKPTIFITGRQHANEVSSTSHILRLAELLVTDKAYKDILKKVNVVLHPVENPDGAQMAFDLQKLTPTHMLHAGRYSALGQDVASLVGLPDPLLPESLVRDARVARLAARHLSEPARLPVARVGAAVCRLRAAGLPHVSVDARLVHDDRDAARSALSRITPTRPRRCARRSSARSTRNPDVRAMDLRHQARYRKWAYGFGPYVFNQEIYKDTAIYYSDPETGEPSGSRRFGAGRGGNPGGEGGGAGGGTGRFSMNAWPQVTFFSGGTEAPDETAQGEWLNLVAKAGLLVSDGERQVPARRTLHRAPHRGRRRA